MVGFVVAGAPGLAVLLALGAVGVAALRRSRLGLTPLECVAYGVPAGIVAMSLVLLGLAVAAGRLPAGLVLGGAAASLGVACWLCRSPLSDLRRAVGRPPKESSPGAPAGPLASTARWLVRGVDWIPVLLFAAVALYQAHFWSRALRFEGGALVASQQNVYGDWGMHLGDVTSFLWGDNFPPTHPRLAGAPMSYHYLASFTAAALASVGLDPVLSMTTQSFLLMLCIVLGLYAFGLRVIGHRPSALLLVPLFLLGGGYGWVPLLGRLDFSPSDPLGVLHQRVFDRQLLRGLGYPLPNPEYMFQAQRGYLYGVPLALLTISLLLTVVRRIHGRVAAAAPPRVTPAGPVGSSGRGKLWAARPTGREARLFAAAGVAAGILPIGHFSTIYALALALPAVALLSLVVRPLRPAARVRRAAVPLAMGWATFGTIWVALTVPQVLWVYGGELGAGSALRVQWGWLAGDDPWWFFWLKNIGSLAALFPIAVFTRGTLDGVARRFLLGFSAIFVLGNVFAFLPWDWNNALFFQYWLLSVAVFVAALVGRAWARRETDIVAHVALTAVVLSITGLGLLVDLNQFTADDRWVLLDEEGVALAGWVRAETPADAVFATGTQYDNPIAVLSGRKVVVGYTTWLGTQGLDYAMQERDVRAILQFDPETPTLLAKHRVDYVAIGPWEVEHLHADKLAFTERYRTIVSSTNWAVFAVSDRARAAFPTYAPVEAVGEQAGARLVLVTDGPRRGAVPGIAWRDPPRGTRPEPDGVAEIEATFAQMDAADDSGVWSWSEQEELIDAFRERDPLGAVHSEDFYRREWAVRSRRYNGSFHWAPLERGDDDGIRGLADGRVGVVSRDPASGIGIFVVMVERDGRWLVDEFLQGSLDGRVLG